MISIRSPSTSCPTKRKPLSSKWLLSSGLTLKQDGVLSNENNGQFKCLTEYHFTILFTDRVARLGKFPPDHSDCSKCLQSQRSMTKVTFYTTFMSLMRDMHQNKPDMVNLDVNDGWKLCKYESSLSVKHITIPPLLAPTPHPDFSALVSGSAL